jgi:hypothetical protein
LLVEDVRFRGGVMMQKSFSLKWSNVCSFTLGRFDEVEEIFVVFRVASSSPNMELMWLSYACLHLR